MIVFFLFFVVIICCHLNYFSLVYLNLWLYWQYRPCINHFTYLYLIPLSLSLSLSYFLAWTLRIFALPLSAVETCSRTPARTISRFPRVYIR